LLNVILGELPIVIGTSIVEGKVAYCSQEPWIFTGTILQNIICGNEFDLERYHQVILATALEKNFQQLPQRDSSVIGDGGISLSGGQKARVNLARCLYIDADIYLLDDPLSAVDTQMGSHIFEKAIKGLLHEKIRVLVTHNLEYFPDSDQILLLNLVRKLFLKRIMYKTYHLFSFLKGKVEFTGSYKEFQMKMSHPTKLIPDPETHESEDSGDEQDDTSNDWKGKMYSTGERQKSIFKYARRQSRNVTAKSMNEVKFLYFHHKSYKKN